MTIKEIAKLSGVGVSTVSRYLNDGYVSDKNREIISKVIKENNYTPSVAASIMRGKSNEIVVIVQRVTSPTSSRLLEGIISECTKLNLSVTIQVVHFDDKLQEKYIKSAINRKVLGIIISAFSEDVKVDYDNVLVIGQKSIYHNSFYPEGRQIFKSMVSEILHNNKLIKHVVINGIEIMDIEFINRVDGSVHACNEFGISNEVIIQDFDKIQEFKLSKGTYYICLTDAQAYGIISLANSQNLIVGRDIFVSGYGDYSTSKMLNLTTIDGHPESLGINAVRMISDKNLSDMKINGSIIYRSSTFENGFQK